MKSPGSSLFANQAKITKIRLKIQELEKRKKDHLKKIDEINRAIDGLLGEIKVLSS